jgi:hypothetical protein
MNRFGLALAAAGLVCALGVVPGAFAAEQINVTSDSAPGWAPSKAQSNSVASAVRKFLAAKDSGRYADAYGLLAERDQRGMPFDQFQIQARDFNTVAGAVVDRTISKVTWTKDPADGPGPGVYAAVDLVSRFAKVDRYCGYVVLYQSPEGGPFRVMREEETYLDNATALAMDQAGAPGDADKTWAKKVSETCPNYAPAPQSRS